VEIGIIITAFNCINYTKACINSIHTISPFHLILIDDYSTDDTKKYFAALERSHKDNSLQSDQPIKDVVVITDPDTDSLTEKWNLGMTVCKERNLIAGLICNNDILFSKYTIDAVIKRLQQGIEINENIAMVTACNIRDQITPEEIFTIPFPESGSEADSPDFSCFLFRTDIWATWGGFDPNYKIAYFEDNDTHIAMAKLGYRCISTTTAPYYHYGSVTQNSVPGGICKGHNFEANRTYFLNKWKVDSTSQEYVDIINSAKK